MCIVLKRILYMHIWNASIYKDDFPPVSITNLRKRTKNKDKRLTSEINLSFGFSHLSFISYSLIDMMQLKTIKIFDTMTHIF